MRINNIHIAGLFLIFPLVLFGCGAKEATVFTSSEWQEEIDTIGSDEKIGLLLGKSYYLDGKSAADKNDEREDIETKLEKCLKRSAGTRRPPIHVLPTDSIKQHLSQDYGLTDFANLSPTDLVNKLQTETPSRDILKSGLRYLIAVDISTKKDSSFRPYIEGHGDSGGGIIVLGLGEDGVKKTSIDVNVIDVKERGTAKISNISSSGNQGWTAGMGVLYASGSIPLILPLPYIAPWISFTETKACNTFGEYIVDLVTPQMDTEQTISALRSGDVVLLKLKKGASHKVTITYINDKFVVGHREYQPGHTTGISFNREDVIDVKILKAQATSPNEPIGKIDLSSFSPGETVKITLKSGEKQKVTITSIDENFLAGHAYFSSSQTTGVSYDRRSIRRIESLK